MSVGELIEELKDFDDDAPVVIAHKGIYNVEVMEGSMLGKPCVWLKVPRAPCPE
ncbi:hypothetical protein KAU33_02490 [Candidatus Dependentiae bacterium]|nr:hypothetical protein [Candidatus Dependentiae bacterium]